MGDVITISTELSTKGFEAGSRALTRAMRNLTQSAQRMGSSIKRIIPTIIGVGSAYQVLSKAINTYMSQNEELSQRMTSIWTALGNVIGPIVEKIIDWVTSAVSYLLAFLKVLGVTSKSASQLSQSAKKNNEELRRTIFGFDELNVLQKQAEDKDKDKGTGLKDVELPDWVKELVDFFKNKKWDDAADLLIEKLDELIYKFRDKAYDLGKAISEYLGGIIHTIARVLDETDWHALGQGIARFINGLFEDVDGEDLGKLLVAKFTIAFKILTGFLEDLDFGQLAEKLSGMISGAFDAMARAIEEADFQKIGEGIRTFFAHIDWPRIARSIGEFLSAAWSGAVDFLSGVLGNDIREKLIDPIKRAFEPLVSIFSTNGSGWVDSLLKIANTIKDVLGYTGSAVIEVIPKFLTQIASGLSGLPASLASIVENLGKLWKDAILPMLKDVTNSGVVEAFFKALSAFIEMCAKTLEAVMPHLISFVNDFMRPLVSVVSQLATMALDEITRWFNNFNSTTVGALSFAEQIKLIGTEWMGLVGYIKDGVGDADYYLQTFAGRFDTLAASMELGTREFEDASAISKEYADKIRELGEEFSKTAYESANEEEAERKRKEILEQLNVVVDDYTKALAEAGYTIDEHGKIVEVATQKTEEFSEATQKSSTAISGSINDLHDFAEYLNKVSEMKFDNFELYNETLKQLAQSLGITTDELKAQIEAAGGDATQIEALKVATADYLVQMAQSGQLTSGYVQSLREQGLITDEVIKLMKDQGVIIRENGQVIVETSNAVRDQADAAKNAADSQRQATEATSETIQKLQEMPGTASEAATGMENLGTDTKNAADTVSNSTDDMKQKSAQSVQELAQEVSKAKDSIKEDFEELSTLSDSVQRTMESIEGTVSSKTDTVLGSLRNWKSEITSIFQEIESQLQSSTQNMQYTVSGAFDTIRATIESAIYSIESLDWSIPAPHVPHINVWYDTVYSDDGSSYNIPQFDVEWYKKGGIFDKATLIGVGEDGEEAVIPLENNTEWISKLADQFIMALENGKYRLNSNLGALAAMQGIGDTVDYRTPAIARGTVLPYSVISDVGSSSGSYVGDSEILDALREFSGKVDTIISLIDGIEFVAEFDNIRALARRIRQENREADIAEGSW